MNELDVILSGCRATKHLVGRLRMILAEMPNGETEEMIPADDLTALLRDIVAVVDTTPRAMLTADVLAVYERAKVMLPGVAAFAEHGMDACGQGDA